MALLSRGVVKLSLRKTTNMATGQLVLVDDLFEYKKEEGTVSIVVMSTVLISPTRSLRK